MTVIFTDLETTGLNIFTDSILEISAIAVSEDLTEMLGWHSQTIKVSEGARDSLMKQAGDYVREMHSKNGLWEEIVRTDPGKDYKYANELCKDFFMWCEDYMPDPNTTDPDLKLKLAGDSVDFDNDFLWVTYNPFWQFFNYRHWNLSSILAPIKEWHPLLYHEIRDYLYDPEAEETHRGMTDCFSSWQKAIVLRRVITSPITTSLDYAIPWSDFKGYSAALDYMRGINHNSYLPMVPMAF